MNNKIELRNISSLSGLNFVIPDYQRGYRWTQTQVEKLLDDFLKFIDRCSSHQVATGEFYCLQPIVVKNVSSDPDKPIYEVIDGQQRLTTLFLLFKCLSWEDIQKNYDVESYHITYQSRPDSKDFLENIENKKTEDAIAFIDFFHIKMVFDAIKKWLSDNKKQNKMIDLLFDENIQNGKDIASNVRVIWYEIGDQEKATPIDIFTRLNIGKIPLTNAELIKALLLSSGNFVDSNPKDGMLTQFHIAEEWNQIEQKLQDKAFWYFIYNSRNPIQYETRIEYIFDLMKSKYTTNIDDDKDFYYTFEAFNSDFEEVSDKAKAVEKVWNDVKEFFGIIESWYASHELFHLIGYLIEIGTSIQELLNESKKCTKTEFVAYVKTLIKDYLKDVDLDTILYKNKKTKNVLLLFNILTVLESDRSDIRFSFDKYKTESWDKEHIASQHNQEFPTEVAKRKTWLNDMIFYFVGVKGKDEELIKTLTQEISGLKSKTTLSHKENECLAILEKLKKVKELSRKTSETDKRQFNTEFNTLYHSVLGHFKDNNIPDDEKDKLSNMALLNASINRSYGDAFFSVKLSVIKENDMTGVFVPIATKNVFMKYYSTKIDNMMYWTQDDAADYLTAIKSTLSNYLTNED